MSMDAGGLAQITYNSSLNNGGSLGGPGASFASRGKGSQLKRLSVPPPRTPTVDESQPSVPVSTPRTSRSHLLAGLRTAPKTATVPSATQRQQHLGVDSGRSTGFADRAVSGVPQTATGASFPRHSYVGNHGIDASTARPMYTLPEQVLAPPALDAAGDMGVDEGLYAELMSTNLFLAAQQQRLQQQLMSVTAAAQQFQGLNLGTPMRQQQLLPSLSMPGVGFYQKQLQQGVQPVVQPVPGQAGLFCVYNPLTGQQNFVYDHMTSQEFSSSPRQEETQSPNPQIPTFRAEVSPPPESTQAPVHLSHPDSPSHSSPSPPQDNTPLPPPSANAFRRGHRKSTSFNPGPKTNIDTARANTAVGGVPKTAALPYTPATGTFGPGQGRAGEHPIRQPRGPPALEELVAKPTSKHDGSKNFAARQRRRAVHNLVRAGIERRGESRSLGQHSSGGSNTPASENEFTFSDGDDVTARSGSLSSRPSLGSLRAAANGAIGSERKERTCRESRSQDSPYSAGTPTSEDGVFPGKFGDVRVDQVSSPSSSPSAAAVFAGQKAAAPGPERRKTPMLVLSSAEKRKTPIV